MNFGRKRRNSRLWPNWIVFFPLATIFALDPQVLLALASIM
jgi:hypothetical protein